MFRNPYFYANLLLSVLFISLFICIFFFTYASRVERQIVIDQTNQIVDQFTDTIHEVTPQNELLSDFVSKLDPGDLSTEDEKVAQQNRALLQQATLWIGIFVVVLVILSAGIVWYWKLDWKKLLWTNLIILFCVALTEFFFLGFIARNYISFDPNYIKFVVVSHLQKYKDDHSSTGKEK